jgi:hypothetical protein
VKRRPRRLRRCGCGSPATHRVAVRTVWFDGAWQRTSSEHCRPCAGEVVTLWDFRTHTEAIIDANVRAFRFRTVN